MIEVNGRWYSRPRGPTAVVCLDGADPEYFADVLEHCDVPALRRFRMSGSWAPARSVVPSFTNPNNVSIVTGVPPRDHGITGNHFYDPILDREVAMNRRSLVRCPTILDALADAGVAVAAVTAKSKLLDLLTKAPSFSAEAPSARALALAGPAPSTVYSAEASLYAIELGRRLLETGEAELVYLSTTDYIQHKHAPGSAAARAFYEALDRALDALDQIGARIVLTADHGMSDKTNDDGTPNITYLEPSLPAGSRVLLPITDPYVVHHGALGSMATIYTGGQAAAARAVRTLPGVERVLTRSEAADLLELDPERIGELVVLADRRTTLGKSPESHDLRDVREGLRSHGGAWESEVQLISNRPGCSPAKDARNFDAFCWALPAVDQLNTPS